MNSFGKKPNQKTIRAAIEIEGCYDDIQPFFQHLPAGLKINRCHHKER